jgi:hypothetical protein
MPAIGCMQNNPWCFSRSSDDFCTADLGIRRKSSLAHRARARRD